MSKLETLVAALKTRIESGEWKGDEQVPSRLVLAKECGVSPTTASNAIRRLEKEGLVYVVSGKGAFVLSQQERRQGRGYTIGVRSSYGKSGFHRDAMGNYTTPTPVGLPLFREIWMAANEYQSHILLLADGRPMESPRMGGPEGVIFIGGETLPEAIKLRSAGFPVVICYEPAEPTTLNYLNFDNAGALAAIVERFVKEGHRRIAVLNGFVTVAGATSRLKAKFLSTLSELGVISDFREAYWRVYDHENGAPDPFHLARQEVEALFELPEPPTAIFAWTPRVAEYLLEAAERRGLSVPRDLSLACTYVERAPAGKISGFLLPYETLSKLLIQEMIQTIENPFHGVQHLVPLVFEEGATIGPVPLKKHGLTGGAAL